MRKMPGYERFQILRRAADTMFARQQELGRLISLEEGKTLAEGVFEASRAAETMELSAEEAKAAGRRSAAAGRRSGRGGKLGFTLRVPCGVVVAITPFNFPLNLVCHKVGPALAGGNAVILKPASDTPLSALKLVEILLEAGLPPLAIACLTGSGGELGKALCRDERVRKISFTGSVEVGKQICAVAGLKRVTMELGSNSPLIILDDADLNKVADAVLATGFGNAGQVCISTQRVIAPRSRVYGDLLDVLKPQGRAAHKTGDPLTEGTKMGPMIREHDAARVESGSMKPSQQGAQARRRRLAAGNALRSRRSSPTSKPAMRSSKTSCLAPPSASAKRPHRRSHRPGQPFPLRPIRRHLHAGHRFRPEIRPRSRCRQPAHQLGPRLAGRPDALRRPQGKRLWQRGPEYAIQEMTELKTVVIHGP